MAPLFLRLDRQGGDSPAGKGDGPAAPRLTPSTRTAPSGPRTAQDGPAAPRLTPSTRTAPSGAGVAPLRL